MLILFQLYEVDVILVDFCWVLDFCLFCYVQINIYFILLDVQGFKMYYDDYDVFVLQVFGLKFWCFYDMFVDKFFWGEGFWLGDYEIGDFVEEFVLEVGDCVYVLCGLMYDVLIYGDEVLLYIIVGLIVKIWVDLMLEVILEVVFCYLEFC